MFYHAKRHGRLNVSYKARFTVWHIR